MKGCIKVFLLVLIIVCSGEGGHNVTLRIPAVEKVVLPCCVNRPVDSVDRLTWKFSNTWVAWKDSRKTVNLSSGYTLHLYDSSLVVEKPKQGLYECVVFINESDQTRRENRVELIVQESLRERVNVSEHEDAVLTCSAGEYTSPNVTWYRESDQIKDHTFSPSILHDGPVLEIKKVTKSDSGVYICNVTQITGDTIETKLQYFTLNVQEGTIVVELVCGIIGAVIFILGVAAVVICFIKRRRKSKHTPDGNKSPDLVPPDMPGSLNNLEKEAMIR